MRIRRISRPSTCSAPGGSGRGRRGFTLIEAVFALAIAALLCGAVAAGLTVVCRERQDEVRCRELSLALRDMTARRGLGAKPFASVTNSERAISEETARTEVQEGERRKVWEVWTLSAADRPSRRVRIGFPDAANDRDREPDSDQPPKRGRYGREEPGSLPPPPGPR